MSKILDASCDASGKVTVAGQVITPVTILSEGKQASTGVVIIEDEKVFYVASSATDIKSTIEKLADTVTKIANVLTSIGAGMTGPTTAPPGTLASDVAAINANVTDLNTLKGALK